jgi:O-antigen/teichoic acid export membrane protein
MSLAESGLRLLVAKVISTVILFVGLAYFARELSPALMGSFFLFRVLNDGAGLLSDAGMRRGVEKRVSEDERPSETVTTGLVMKLASALCFGSVVFLLRGTINGYLGAPLATLLAASIVVRELGWFGVHVLRGELRIRETAVIEASRLVVWVCLGVVLVELGYGVRGVAYGFIAGLVSLTVLAFVRIDTPFGRPSVEAASSILSFSKYDFVSNAGDYIYNWIDIGIIGLFLTQNAVGIYEYAWQITLPVALLVETTTATLFPQISRWHTSEATGEIGRVVSQTINAGLFVSVPALFGALLFAEPILSVLFGPPYAAGAVVLIVLMGEKVIRAVQSILNVTLRGIDRPKEAAVATAITIVTNLGLNFALVPVYGIRGAAVATFASVLLNGIVHWHYLSGHVDLRFPVALGSRVIAASVLMFVPLAVLDRLVRIDTLPELLSVVVVGVVIYLGGASLVPVLRREIIYPGIEIVLGSSEPPNER